MKRYFSISKSVLLAAALMVFGSCQDSWNEHYSFKETESKYPVAKLAETLHQVSGYGKFYDALRYTKMCDKNGFPLDETFLDLLMEDQFMTVFAPSDAADVDWALYTKKGKTDAEHKEVGEKFLKNHIARFKNSVTSDTVKVTMLNGKIYSIMPTSIEGNAYHGDDLNLRCSNGVLHCIDGYLTYLPNLYEFITTDPTYKPILGDWYKSFTVKELDPYESVAGGLNENGEIWYVDSVTYESNILMSRYARIIAEDSTYAMVLPSPTLWDTVYNRIAKSFEYAEKALNNDSLQQFYTRTTMLTDLFFSLNPKVQRYLPDSVVSTLYSAAENRREGIAYHVFGHPYANDGIFGSASSTVKCSNGIIYIIDEWPFVDTLTYLRPIKLEAESITNLYGFIAKQQPVSVVGDDTLKNPIQVMRISQEGVKNWTAKVFLYDNLKGKYRVKFVFAPNTVDDMPCYIHPIVSYNMPDGTTETLIDSARVVKQEIAPGMFIEQKINFYMVNDMTKLDTIDIGVVDIPYCNYDMLQSKLSVTMVSGVNERNSEKYTSEVWLDCIILDPIVE
ncbi:MAG: hypothetical protein J6P66_08655 [Bacteroidaceae bacterium]|nr:hypothetical protein [Bacteroidaceae bacterium]MBO7112085.1 hypothetical protein [Bacteroidaceae bacterium]